MADVDPDMELRAAPKKPLEFEDAEVIGPLEVATVEESDEAIESVLCDCGNGGMEEVAVRRTRTKRRPRTHFERHFFRCPSCGTEKVLLLDVTRRREVLGV